MMVTILTGNLHKTPLLILLKAWCHKIYKVDAQGGLSQLLALLFGLYSFGLLKNPTYPSHSFTSSAVLICS